MGLVEIGQYKRDLAVGNHISVQIKPYAQCFGKLIGAVEYGDRRSAGDRQRVAVVLSRYCSGSNDVSTVRAMAFPDALGVTGSSRLCTGRCSGDPPCRKLHQRRGVAGAENCDGASYTRVQRHCRLYHAGQRAHGPCDSNFCESQNGAKRGKERSSGGHFRGISVVQLSFSGVYTRRSKCNALDPLN